MAERFFSSVAEAAKQPAGLTSEISRKFVSESSLGEAAAARAAAGLPSQDDAPYDPRPLYEKLAERKRIEDEELSEKLRFANQLKKLDPDEIEFLAESKRERHEKERQIRLADHAELEAFRSARSAIVVPAVPILHSHASLSTVADSIMKRKPPSSASPLPTPHPDIPSPLLAPSASQISDTPASPTHRHIHPKSSHLATAIDAQRSILLKGVKRKNSSSNASQQPPHHPSKQVRQASPHKTISRDQPRIQPSSTTKSNALKATTATTSKADHTPAQSHGAGLAALASAYDSSDDSSTD